MHGGTITSDDSDGRRQVAGIPAPSQRAASAKPCELWGILNVTDDSFSDGGRYLRADAALERARELVAEGAAVIDVGGASSRPRGATYGPGAPELDEHEERARVEPVLVGLRELGVRISIDTTRASVAELALSLGASIVNDVSCAASGELLAVAAQHRAFYVVMHTRGRGEVAAPATTYTDVCEEVKAELSAGVARAEAAGIERNRIWLDPGIGFAKTGEQSATLVSRLGAIVSLGFPVLVGASRKGFLAELASRPDGSRPSPLEREPASAAVVALAVQRGVAALRVHDVAAARQALLITQAIMRFEAAC